MFLSLKLKNFFLIFKCFQYFNFKINRTYTKNVKSYPIFTTPSPNLTLEDVEMKSSTTKKSELLLILDDSDLITQYILKYCYSR